MAAIDEFTGWRGLREEPSGWKSGREGTDEAGGKSESGREESEKHTTGVTK